MLKLSTRRLTNLKRTVSRSIEEQVNLVEEPIWRVADSDSGIWKHRLYYTKVTVMSNGRRFNWIIVKARLSTWVFVLMNMICWPLLPKNDQRLGESEYSYISLSSAIIPRTSQRWLGCYSTKWVFSFFSFSFSFSFYTVNLIKKVLLWSECIRPQYRPFQIIYWRVASPSKTECNSRSQFRME